jgi:hypothetical protein
VAVARTAGSRRARCARTRRSPPAHPIASFLDPPGCGLIRWPTRRSLPAAGGGSDRKCERVRKRGFRTRSGCVSKLCRVGRAIDAAAGSVGSGSSMARWSASSSRRFGVGCVGSRPSARTGGPHRVSLRWLLRHSPPFSSCGSFLRPGTGYSKPTGANIGRSPHRAMGGLPTASAFLRHPVSGPAPPAPLSRGRPGRCGRSPPAGRPSGPSAWSGSARSRRAGPARPRPP